MKMKMTICAALLVGLMLAAPLGVQSLTEVETETPPPEVNADNQAGYLRQGNLLILMYHDFCEEPPTDNESMQLFTTGEKFAADIDALLELGYLPISLEDYYLGRAEQGQKYFALTFDDGYQGVYNFAYPVLQEKQVPGALFFNTGQAWTLGFLHYWQLREFEENGLIKVYSHLAYHMKATQMPLEEFTRYLDASLRDLRQYLYLDEHPLFLAYPYGDYNRETYQAALERGIGIQLVQKMIFPEGDLFVRVNVPYDADMAKLVKKAPHN